MTSLSATLGASASFLMAGIGLSVTAGVTLILTGSFISCCAPCVGVPIILVGAFTIPTGIVVTVGATGANTVEGIIEFAEEVVTKLAGLDSHHAQHSEF